MKYKRKKMWKAWIFFLFFFVAFFTVPIVYTKLFVENKENEADKIVSNEEQLKTIGYSLNDISFLLENKETLNYALNNSYDTKLMEYAKHENFNIEKINDYYKYENKNPDAPKEDIIKLVNMDINYEYSEKLMNLINEKYFIKENIKRYMNYNAATLTEVVRNVNCNLDYEFYTSLKATNIEDGKLMLVNKYYYLDKNFEGDNLVNVEPNYGVGMLNKEAYEAFKRMSNDARNEGLYILSRSPYRSYGTQYSIYNNYKNTRGLAWADSWSARPGHSEHQTGYALDVKSYTSDSLDSFGYTKEYAWMQNNAHKYGFILRYPSGKEFITGYNFENWHYRYVGVDAATIIVTENITFEEYYAYYVKK